MQNQCVGLAEALGMQAVVKRVVPRSPWKFLPPALWPAPLTMVAEDTPLNPPWPRVVISCGRRSVAAGMAVRRAAGEETFAVHIQEPHAPPSRFDLVIVPEHDSLRGENVMVVNGALHHLTREKLAAAGTKFAPMFAHLPRPLVAVLVGGSNRKHTISPAVIHELSDKLIAAAKKTGASLAVTPSRRTGATNIAVLRERLKDFGYVWNFEGENPYFGLLSLADSIVVTADSVSMVSEACFTGKPVHVFELEGGSRRLVQFHKNMSRAEMTRPFRGAFEKWSYQSLDETARAAGEIRRRMAKLRPTAISQPAQSTKLEPTL